MKAQFAWIGAPCIAAVLLGSLLTGCGSGSGGRPGSSLGGGDQNAGGSSGQEFTFGSLSGRAVLSNPPVTTNGYGATVTGLKGDISSLTLNDPSPNLAETRIAFYSLRDGHSEIYTMNADGSNQTRLTNNPEGNYFPSWKSDGTKITFASNRDGNSEIYTMNADGTGQTRLTNNPAYDTGPSRSPDGTKIAFDSDRDGNDEIYVMNADGTGQTRLTNNAGLDFYPSWSPDGKKITFYSSRDGNFEIYVMNADGSNQTRLTNNTAADHDPCFSPDGTKIAFHSYRDGNYEIYVMNADGSNQTRLTNNTNWDQHPTWSPDGTKIVFNGYRGSSHEIIVMNADGSNQTLLTNDLANDYMPNWGSFVKQRKLIGSGGTLSGSNTAGFIFARGQGNSYSLGEVVNSIVAFDGNPRSGVTLKTLTDLNNNGPILTYMIEADSPNTITLLSYLNNPDYFKPIKIVGTGTSLTTANGVLVDFSSQTGKVTAVLPFAGTRAAGAGQPMLQEENGQRVYRGAFVGVFDATGKNLAPRGAREVRCDAQTGKVLQAQ